MLDGSCHKGIARFAIKSFLSSAATLATDFGKRGGKPYQCLVITDQALSAP